MRKIGGIRANFGFLVAGTPLFLFLLVIIFLIIYLCQNGIRVISWEFLTSFPKKGMTEGGILPAAVGTIYVTFVALLFAVPIGIGSGIYLSEYAPNNILVKVIRSSVRSLAGIPSIVYGLFGVAFFVRVLGFGMSILASGLTLSLLVLPVIITTTEEALKAIPLSFREGSLALGATKWETIRFQVLPYAFPGILTGVLLSFARACGETAPILFTGVTFYLRHLPKTPLNKFMALPYHLYILSTQHENILKVRPIAFGTAIVLLTLVLFFSGIALYFRMKFAKRQW
ncbi:MAG: phosphate ABC transporter permease PstA [candidate division WOR-3 bacterium]